MNKKTDIQKMVDEALESLSGIRKAEPQPFFYTRLHARLVRKKHNSWELLGRLVSRPAIAFLSIALVILLNTVVMVTESHHAGSAEKSEIAVADEYNQTSSFYDLENASAE